jgi:hypothetical protein
MRWETISSVFSLIVTACPPGAVVGGDVIAKFGNEVGSEGRALISMLIAERDAEEIEGDD